MKKKKDENIFYVYAYLDSRKNGVYMYSGDSFTLKFEYEPFYIGAGHGRRAYNHLYKNARTNIDNKSLIRTIREETKEDPKIIFIQSGLTECKAKLLEIKCIASIGRKNLLKGPLTNKTNGGDGTSGFVMSTKHLEIIKDKNSKPIIQYDLFGNFLREWKSIEIASQSMWIDRTSISSALSEKTKTAGEFIWMYKNYFTNNEIPKKLNPEIVNKLTSIKNDKYKKIVVQFSKNGRFIKTFSSIEAAAEVVKTGRSSIKVVCADRDKQYHKTAGGFTWFFENDFKNNKIPNKLNIDLVKKINVTRNRAKKLLQFSNNMELVSEWVSIETASSTLKIPRSTISTACSGKHGHHRAVGFIWKYCKPNKNFKIKVSSKKQQKIGQFSSEDSVLIKIWSTVTQASKLLNIDRSQISRVCKNKNKTAGGFIWKYC